MDMNFPRLLVAKDSMDRLNEVVEFVTRSKEDGVRTMALKIRSTPGDRRFGRKPFQLATTEGQDRFLAQIQVLASVGCANVWYQLFNRFALCLKVMPDQPIPI